MRAGVVPVCLAVSLLVALPACVDRLAAPEQAEEPQQVEEDDEDDESTPAGTYPLRRVNGESLPVEIRIGDGVEIEIKSGRLELAGNRTCSSRMEAVVERGDEKKKETQVRRCTWTSSGSLLRLRWIDGGEQNASWSGDEIAFSSGNVHYLFRRD